MSARFESDALPILPVAPLAPGNAHAGLVLGDGVGPPPPRLYWRMPRSTTLCPHMGARWQRPQGSARLLGQNCGRQPENSVP